MLPEARSRSSPALLDRPRRRDAGSCVRVSAQPLATTPTSTSCFRRAAASSRRWRSRVPSMAGRRFKSSRTRVDGSPQTARTAERGARVVAVTGLPEAVTNRIFSITLQPAARRLAPRRSDGRAAFADGCGKQVGAVGMADRRRTRPRDRLCDASAWEARDRGVPAQLTKRHSVRVVVQDPATDAELYRSPADIPVRLGV